LAIEWKSTTIQYGTKLVTLPTTPIHPKPGKSLSPELLLVGHGEDGLHNGLPTQASAGKLGVEAGPEPMTLQGAEYGYASFGAVNGFSGGGVFNATGDIVGVFTGTRGVKDPKTGAQGPAFLNLTRLLGMKGTPRLQGWLKDPDTPILNRGDLWYQVARR
jgi:hypothetical protein